MSEANRGITEHTISIPIGHATIEGTLSRPESPTGLIVFAHGSGSSRFSRRNRFVAAALNDAGFATLLLDLLTRREEEVDEFTRAHRFDIALLADRVVAAADWIGADTELSALPIGLFGASTGAAAALVAAGRRREIVHAVVSRGGRPDLAGKDLSGVSAPTLLIVGGADDLVIDLNERARDAMRAEVRLEIIPGATHLFEEPGALAQVAELARDWFLLHLHRESASPARR
jgi:dienelactone hydrolase